MNPVTEIIAGTEPTWTTPRSPRRRADLHLGTLGVTQGNDGQVNSLPALDGKVIRNAMTHLEGTDAMANLRGLAWAAAIDTSTTSSVSTT